MANKPRKRIGIIALLHESNTFLEQPTELEHFLQNILCTGPQVLEVFRGTHHEVGGFIERLDQVPSVELVGVFAARAMPYGKISATCWDALMGVLERSIQHAGPIDAWLVAPHGAAVAENASDADGDWLTRLRSLVGRDKTIVGTLDMHANVSEKMVKACDALLAYKTNPHLDQKERGIKAASLLLDSLESHQRLYTGFASLPMSINIERQATAEPQGVLLHQWEARWYERESNLVDVSWVYGFPYADVQEMGASVLTLVWDDPEQANSIAEELAKLWWTRREEFRGKKIGGRDAVELAKQSKGTAGLLDMGDNIGGGSPGDGTIIAHELLHQECLPAFLWLHDPSSVQQATEIGAGNRGKFSLGGKTDPRHGSPIVDTFEVVSLHDGRFRDNQVRHGGYCTYDQGPTAVLRSAKGLVIMIASERVAPVSLAQLTEFGIRPNDYRAIVIKGVHAPVAAYAEFCDRMIRVNTPGVTTADDEALEYQNRRKPMFPWEFVAG
jgi:microcystin degradation protein MlrC